MAFFAALSAILSVVCLWTARLVVLERRRANQLDAGFEVVRDALWEAEERAERIRLEGERALEEAEARAEAGARAKSRFLATVTHEMRTPLTGVIGTAGLLLDARLAPDQRTYARAILSSAEAMLGLVDEILDLSRVEAERAAPAEDPYSPAAIVEDVAELLAPRARDKGLDFAMRVGASVPAEALGDGPRIRQVLLNLAGNAVKFTEAGGVGLKVEAGADGLRFVVEDTGPGFDPAETERLFEEFERGEDVGAAAGAGLGLAISRRLASAMGGSLSGFAAPGQGATFTLALPAAAPGGAADQPLQGRRIAIVSGQPFTGPWLAESLAAMGATAFLVEPEDLAVPGRVRLDGVFAALIDRDSGPAPATLAAAARLAGAERALLLLSPADRGELDRLAEQGFDGYLVKPVRAASLASRILDPLGQDERRDAGAAEAMSPPVPFPSGSGLKLLVAEDDPVSALIALAHLARLGHASVHVADGEAACAAFEREAFDACLIDIRMPRLDGCEVARRMRALEIETGRTPALILALTANVGDDEAALAAGMDAVMTKPLDRRALEAALESLAKPARAAVA